MKKLLTTTLLLALTLIAQAQSKNMTLVAEDNCGTKGKQPFLLSGESYIFAGAKVDDKAARTCTFGDKVIYTYDGMDIQADYSLELKFYAAPEDRKRIIRILSDTRELATITLNPGQPLTKKIDLPKFAYAYGKMQLVFEKIEGPNALVSAIKIFSSNPKKLKPSENAKINKITDYSKFPVPRPVYAPRPATTTGTANPVINLNGEWSFHTAPPENFPADLGTGWQAIQVPGHWATQGFTVKDGTYAGYVRKFNLPADWQSKQVRLRFDSVFSDCIVYVNGSEAGRHLGTFTAFEFNITDLLQPGENTLALKVRNDSQADVLGSLNQYANFPLGGILRKVTLFALPELHFTDLRIATTFDSAFKDGVLSLQIDVTNQGITPATRSTVQAKVPGLLDTYTIHTPHLEPGQTTTLHASIPVREPKPWNNEHPHLYQLNLKLLDGGKKLQTVQKKFGFRQVEVRGNQLFINGSPVKLAGVCRHEAHPLLGRSLTMEQWRKDAELYLKGNVNFIRTSHYPPAEEFVEICDELGLFVELEAPVCWVGHHANYSWRKNDYRDPKWYPYILQANMETIRFHRNNPSIIFWSLANESLWSDNFVNVLKHAQAEDPTRPHAFHDQDYGGFNNQGSYAPVANIHYPGPNGDQSVKNYTRPIVFGEYCHLNVYNREELVTDPGIRNTWGQCLEHIWHKMYATEACLGGSIWSGIDDLFLLPNGKAVGYGAWGPIDGWRRPKPEYFFMKKVYSPVQIGTQRLQPGNSSTVELSNRHNFTNISELKITWSVGEQSGTATANIAPRTDGTLTVNQAVTNGDALTLEFHSPKGYLIDRFVIPVGNENKATTAEKATPSPASIKLKEDGNSYHLTGKDFTCKIDKTSGQITSLKKGAKTILTSAPHLVINPLKGGGCFPNHSADTPDWDPICSEWKATKVEAKSTPNSLTITTNGSYKEATGSFSYTIHGNGTIDLSYDFKTKDKIDPRQVGLCFFLDDAFQSVSWQRTSPFSGFPNDHIGRLSGSAPAFYEGAKPNYTVEQDGTVKRHFIRKQPAHSWSHDANELGSNDFRSTRTGIQWFKMSTDNDNHITILSDGSQAARCRLDGDRVRLFAIDIDTGGSELFLGGHLNRFRHPLAKGATVQGNTTLRIE